MGTPVEELFAQAKTLPPDERIRLAEELLATVQEPDAEVEAAWDAEIKRRIDEIDAGTAKLISSEETFAKAYKIIEQARLRQHK